MADRTLDYRWIDRQDDFDQLVEDLRTQPRYSLDTEFHRERTYYPKLALVQVAWRTDQGQLLALIDPLAVDVTSFASLFVSDALCVIHAAQQDLDVLTHAVGCVPARMFDTQLAAGFVGYGTPSLVSLLQGEIGVTPAKGDRLTDWLRRPLTDSQCQYAAVDVEYLLEVHERLVAKLADADRLGWAEDACEELRAAPDERVRPRRCLAATEGRQVAAAQCPRRGAERGRLARTAGDAHRHPRATGAARPGDPGDRAARAIDGEGTRPGSRGRRSPLPRRSRRGDPRCGPCRQGVAAPSAPPSADDLDRSLRPAVTLVSAWVAQLARDERLDPALLATRADIVAFLRGDEDARLGTGWRNDLVGDGIRRLVGGEAGLTFDGEGRLRLTTVSDRGVSD